MSETSSKRHGGTGHSDPKHGGSRHRARERAVSFLYESQTKGTAATELVADQEVAPDEFVGELLRGVEAHQADIDKLIASHAHEWRIDRMPEVDIAILRLGTYELCFADEIPPAVAIDEAVELAKAYSTEDSPRFINGVLSGILSDWEAG